MPIREQRQEHHAAGKPRQGGDRQKDDEGDEGRDHEHVAMGEVHHPDDAEDHRIADGDQTVDGAQRHAVDQLLDQNFHALRTPPHTTPSDAGFVPTFPGAALKG